jgi:hypothetical protein
VHYRRGPKKPARRRMLELLASSPEGCTEALLVRNGFSIDLLVDPIRAGLATATPEWIEPLRVFRRLFLLRTTRPS